jgi:gamma-glutamyltranspeptidase/glutathione hydrolase
MCVHRPIEGLLLGALLFWGVAAGAGPRPPAAAVASAHPLATEAGLEILAAGGNAFDAAVAVAAALAVVQPHGSGLGGGGFWLLHQAEDGREVMIDGRERAPLAAGPELYTSGPGADDPRASVDGPLSAGIPGQPAALAHLSRHYGRLPLARALAPAIRLAEEGFPVGKAYVRMARFRLEALRAWPEAAAIFLEGGEVPQAGFVLRQPQLARTLQRLGQEGHDGFYAGETARALVEAVRGAGGVWSLEDLAGYRVVERAPVRGEYRGMRVVSAALPSSGGIVLVEMLNVLSGYRLEALDEAQRVHLLVEAMRRAYRDRARWLGDPDHVRVPVERLLSPHYAAGLRVGIHPLHATLSARLAPIDAGPPPGGGHTTHYSILDAEGNRVAATLSINYPFGSGFVAGGTGVLLNDEMDDFVTRPGEPNLYGLVGGAANAVAPGKRMLSSMSPSFLEHDGRIAILGTPGGSRIITMVLQAALAFRNGAGAEDLVSAPRVHHQYLPDRIEAEADALDPDVIEALQERGHRVKLLDRSWGDMQVVIWDRNRGAVDAASDPRGEGAARMLPAARTAPP